MLTVRLMFPMAEPRSTMMTTIFGLDSSKSTFCGMWTPAAPGFPVNGYPARKALTTAQ
ncbi:MAG: hypothetical protein CM15mP74_15010 [Halieaceae bacterium]|nr:MAG: hypothetical protein CM15mP74_15010 [Halieaceae bacterium]